MDLFVNNLRTLGTIGGEDREGGGSVGEKRKEQGGFGKIEQREREGVMGKVSFFFLPIQTEQRRGQSGASWLWWPAGFPGTTAAGSGGSGERRSGATRSCPHLELGRLVERDRRAAADCRLMRHWWQRWEARERGG
jgi:hypothetical protein